MEVERRLPTLRVAARAILPPRCLVSRFLLRGFAALSRSALDGRGPLLAGRLNAASKFPYGGKAADHAIKFHGVDCIIRPRNPGAASRPAGGLGFVELKDLTEHGLAEGKASPGIK